jgi:Fic family protein
VLRKARFWEAHADASFSGRQRLVLNRLLDGFEGKLTSSKWAKLTKVSQATAARDIADLAQRHVLQRTRPAGEAPAIHCEHRCTQSIMIPLDAGRLAIARS